MCLRTMHTARGTALAAIVMLESTVQIYSHSTGCRYLTPFQFGTHDLHSLCRRGKKEAALDFDSLSALPEGALALATRKGQFRLKTASIKKTLLPDDLNYQVGSRENPWHAQMW